MPIILILYMAIMSRLHGWGGFLFCRELSQIGMSLPAFFAVEHFTGNSTASLLAFGATCLAYTLGNADGFKNSTRENAIVSPLAEFLAYCVGTKRDSFWYDTIFWTLKAFIITFPVSIVLLSSKAHLNLFFPMMALSWPVAYAMGRAFYPKYNNLIGEILSGAVSGAAYVALFS